MILHGKAGIGQCVEQRPMAEQGNMMLSYIRIPKQRVSDPVRVRSVDIKDAALFQYFVYVFQGFYGIFEMFQHVIAYDDVKKIFLERKLALGFPHLQYCMRQAL